MTKKSHDAFWVLSMATDYYSDRGRVTARHSFGWDGAISSFVIVTERSGVSALDALPMPIDLAEAFLLKCLEPDFNQLFLSDLYPSQVAEEHIQVGAAELRLIRGRAQLASGGKDRLPSLSLTVCQEGAETKHLCLTHGLRTDLGPRMREFKHAPEWISEQLHFSAAA